MESKVVYNSKLTVEEMAARSGISESAVRRYILNKGIDRKFDEALRKYLLVHKFMAKHEGMPLTEVSKHLGMAYNTVRKYANMTEPPKKERIDKESRVDRSKNAAVFMSVSDNQTVILSSILQLYCHNAATFDCDLTTSVGSFYKHGIPKPKFLYDKYPEQMEGVKSLDEAINLPNDVFNSVVIDLPFFVDEKGNKTVNSFKSLEELYNTNDEMIELAARLLHKQGVLVFKCTDFRYKAKQRWISDYAIHQAEKCGLELVDKFILVAKQKLLCESFSQTVARKNHSYFLVFEKVKDIAKLNSAYKNPCEL